MGAKLENEVAVTKKGIILNKNASPSVRNVFNELNTDKTPDRDGRQVIDTKELKLGGPLPKYRALAVLLSEVTDKDQVKAALTHLKKLPNEELGLVLAISDSKPLVRRFAKADGKRFVEVLLTGKNPEGETPPTTFVSELLFSALEGKDRRKVEQLLEKKDPTFAKALRADPPVALSEDLGPPSASLTQSERKIVNQTEEVLAIDNFATLAFKAAVLSHMAKLQTAGDISKADAINSYLDRVEKFPKLSDGNFDFVRAMKHMAESLPTEISEGLAEAVVSGLEKAINSVRDRNSVSSPIVKE